MKTILLVDHDESVLKFLSMLLRRKKLPTLKAPCHDIAINLVSAVNVDLIVLNLLMPKGNGWDLYRKLRDNPATAHILVVMLSACDDYQTMARAFEEGVDAFVSKRHMHARFAETVEYLLHSHSVVVA